MIFSNPKDYKYFVIFDMDDDKVINDVLNEMSDRKQHSVQGLVAKLSGHIDTADHFREKMIRKKLVKPYTMDGEIITGFGLDVIEIGGWLKYLEGRKRNNKSQHWSGIGANLSTIGGFVLLAFSVYQSFRVDNRNDKIDRLEKQIMKLHRDSAKMYSKMDSLKKK